MPDLSNDAGPEPATEAVTRSAPSKAVLIGVLAVVVVIAGIAWILASGSKSSAPQTSASGGSTTGSVSTPAAATLNFGGGFGPPAHPPYGDDPWLISLTALPGAPAQQTVVMDFTGPGVPSSMTFTVGPAGSTVNHTFILNTCGAWTARVVSINNQPPPKGSSLANASGVSSSCG